jgi:hypothetical protein
MPDDISARGLPAWVRRWAQTTDGYLLALAKAHRGQLATLDRFIPGALLIPVEPRPPLMIREEGVLSDGAFSRASAAGERRTRGFRYFSSFLTAAAIRSSFGITNASSGSLYGTVVSAPVT